MSAAAIRVSGLGKRYRIGERVRYKSLRESLSNAVTRTFRGGRRAEETIWALKDVSFEVAPGEVVGVIGRNGAGKSTLLKILSRITEPTEGRVELHGRVGSLLEVGTGFHLELTGRENIYLNGAILGMKRAEIERKFDEIVAFAEIERFLDTPVKHYSTGMYLRLAFAVAAHLEPEILLVDEVLAVGDAEFQARCLGRIGAIASQGRTVLLVSHNLAAVQSLCTRAVLLSSGRLVTEGVASEVVAHYSTHDAGTALVWSWQDPKTAPGGSYARLSQVRIEANPPSGPALTTSDGVSIAIVFWNLADDASVWAGLHLLDSSGGLVLASINLPSTAIGEDQWRGQPLPKGLYESRVFFPPDFFNDSTYMVRPFLQRTTMELEAAPTDPLAFRIIDSGAMRQEYTAPWQGAIRPRLRWNTTQLSHPNDNQAGELAHRDPGVTGVS